MAVQIRPWPLLSSCRIGRGDHGLGGVLPRVPRAVRSSLARVGRGYTVGYHRDDRFSVDCDGMAIKELRNRPVAIWVYSSAVERLTADQQVPGSNPGVPFCS